MFMMLLAGIGGTGGSCEVIWARLAWGISAGGGALPAVWCIVVLEVIWSGGRTTLYRVLKF